MEKLSVKECLRFGWKTFRSRAWFYVGAAALLCLAGMVYGSFDSFAKHHDSALGFVFGLAALTISFLIGMSQIAFSLRAHDAPSTVSVRSLWAPHPFWKFVGTTVLMWIGIIIGLILLIIPGIIASIAFMFAPYLTMDEGTRPVEALKKSAAMTKGNRWNLFVLLLACAGINILGAILLLVGLLVSIPITLIAIAHAYRVLKGNQGVLPLEEVPSATAA